MTAIVTDSSEKGGKSMLAGGFGRACRYFVRQAELYVLCSVAGGFLMVAYMWMINSFDASFMEVVKLVPNAAVYIAMIVLFTSGISATQYWYSVPISFGCLRKHAFFGNLLMNLLVVVQTAVFYFVALQLFHVQASGFEAVFYLAAFLLLEGGSKFLGIAAMKWGKTVYVIMIIGIIAFSMCMGFVVGYAGVSGMVSPVTSVLGEEIAKHGQWVLGIGAVLCVAANAASWRMLKVFEIKA